MPVFLRVVVVALFASLLGGCEGLGNPSRVRTLQGEWAQGGAVVRTEARSMPAERGRGLLEEPGTLSHVDAEAPRGGVFVRVSVSADGLAVRGRHLLTEFRLGDGRRELRRWQARGPGVQHAVFALAQAPVAVQTRPAS